MIDTIQPLGKNILIVSHKEEKEKGLLIIPETEKKFYKVVNVGEEVAKVHVGDVTIVNIYHGSVYRDPDFLIVDEDAIMAVKR